MHGPRTERAGDAALSQVSGEEATDLAARCKVLIQSLGMTQADAAREIGTSGPQLSQWINGTSKWSGKTVAGLAAKWMRRKETAAAKPKEGSKRKAADGEQSGSTRGPKKRRETLLEVRREPRCTRVCPIKHPRFLCIVRCAGF